MTRQVGSSVDPARVVGQRWLASPGRPVLTVTVEEHIQVPGGGGLSLLRIDLEGGRPLHCSMPLDAAGGPADGPEAIGVGAPWRGLLALAASGGELVGEAGMRLVGLAPANGEAPAASLAASLAAEPAASRIRPLGADQTHTSVVADETVVLKLFRRLAPGLGPEVELGIALDREPDAPVPAFRGALRLVDPAGRRSWDIAIAQRLIPGARDEFEGIADELAAWLRGGAPGGDLPRRTADAAPLGRSVARLHASLARLRGPGRAPRPETAADVERRSRHASRALRNAIRLLRPLDPGLAASLVDRRPRIEAALAPLGALAGRRLQRIHGDLHTGQFLRDGERFVFTDLEGEPTAPVADRRRVDLPVRDLASMLRGFDHVARSGMRRSGQPVEQVAAGATPADPAIDAWLTRMRAGFLGAYLEEAAALGLEADLDRPLLHAIEVEKELYEFAYAATFLTAWRYSPAAGLRWLLDHGPEHA